MFARCTLHVLRVDFVLFAYKIVVSCRRVLTLGVDVTPFSLFRVLGPCLLLAKLTLIFSLSLNLTIIMITQKRFLLLFVMLLFIMCKCVE